MTVVQEKVKIGAFSPPLLHCLILTALHLGLIDTDASQEIGPVIGMIVYDLYDEGVTLPSMYNHLEERVVAVMEPYPADAKITRRLGHVFGQFLIMMNNPKPPSLISYSLFL